MTALAFLAAIIVFLSAIAIAVLVRVAFKFTAAEATDLMFLMSEFTIIKQSSSLRQRELCFKSVFFVLFLFCLILVMALNCFRERFCLANARSFFCQFLKVFC